jgi:biotin transport system substrate-specific component
VLNKKGQFQNIFFMLFSSLQKSFQRLCLSFPKSSAMRIALGFSALSIASQIAIPFYPVPFTMQPMIVLGLAFFFPTSEAFLSVFSWMTAGTLGLPVFSSFSSGPLVILGPRGGYILGFLAAVGVVGLLKKHVPLNTISTFGILLLGCSVIYLMGFSFLAVLLQSKEQAFHLGIVPFWGPDLLKVMVLTALSKKIKLIK